MPNAQKVEMHERDRSAPTRLAALKAETVADMRLQWRGLLDAEPTHAQRTHDRLVKVSLVIVPSWTGAPSALGFFCGRD